MKKWTARFVTLLLIMMILVGASHLLDSLPETYADKDQWAYWAHESSEEPAPVDVFLIGPTVFFGSDGSWNMDVGDEKLRRNFTGALNMQLGIYNTLGRIYAPYYPQVGLNVYELETEEQEPFLEIAYQKVADAFRWYWQEANDGRPVIIAGFSQGAQLGLRLLQDPWTSQHLPEQLVAAYLIGWGVTEEDIQPYPHLKMASGAEDIGVIVSFNSEAEGIETSLIVPEQALGINPLNWKTDSTIAPASLNMGACFTHYSGEILEEIPELTGAYLDAKRGTLKVVDVSPSDYPPVLDLFEPGIYHLYDYQFFYRNLQENVIQRIESFFEAATGKLLESDNLPIRNIQLESNYEFIFPDIVTSHLCS